METNPLKTSLQKWAENTCKEYLEIIHKGYNVAFYQQSPLINITDRPEVVVMGINPGSAGTYTFQKEEMGGHDVTAQHLLHGNRKAWATHDSWAYVRNVKDLLRATFAEILDDDNKLVFTNATFFATSKANELNEKIINITLPRTIELVDILKPKLVIGLSGHNLFRRIKRQNPADFMYECVFGSKLLIGELHGVKYVGIHHTASRYSHPLKRLVSKAIKLIYENQDLPLNQIIKTTQNKCQQEWQAVVNYVPPVSVRYEEAQAIMENIANAFNVPKGKETVTIAINDTIKIVFVAQKSSQYIYCRHNDFNGNRPYDITETNDPYSNILSRYGYQREAYALGKKQLSQFNLIDNPEDNAQLIVDEIKKICTEIRAVLPQGKGGKVTYYRIHP